MKKTVIILFLIVMGLNVLANDTLILNLKEAIEYGNNNSYKIKNSEKEKRIVKKDIWAVKSTYLPKISGNINFNNMLELNPTIVPLSFFNPNASPNETSVVRFGTKYKTDLNLRVDQLIFEGSVIYSKKLLKSYNTMAEIKHEEAKNQNTSKIIKSYVRHLALKQQQSIVKENLNQVKAIKAEIDKMHKLGMVDEIEVLQAKLNVTTVTNLELQNTNQSIIVKRNLKLLLGINQETAFSTKETLEEVLLLYAKKKIDHSFDISENKNYLLSKLNTTSKHLLFKTDKANHLPTINAFYNYTTSAIENNLTFNDFYSSSFVGVLVNIPIFSGGAKINKVAKSKLLFQQAEINMAENKQALLNQKSTLENNFITAKGKYKEALESALLSKKILDNTSKKSKVGIVSSITLAQVNNQYLSAQIKYLQSIVEYISSAVDLDTFTNNENK